MDDLLRIENLNVRFQVNDGMLSAVNNFSMKLKRGEIYALVGESGCGKSTLAFSLMGLLDSDTSEISGKAFYKETELISATQTKMENIRGKEIGMIFQNPLDSLNPVYRSGSQVAEALLIDNIDKKSAWEQVLNLYKKVQIADAKRRIRSFPHELSGGMRQRVMIAMMMARNPNLLICDEPTTALDVTIEAQILGIIKDLKHEFQTTFLIITHNFGIVAEVADRIGVMYAGELIEEGDVFTIFDRPSHPYTKALLGALPRASKGRTHLKTIDGVVPRIIGNYEGCRFDNRCPHADETCRTIFPILEEFEEGHLVRCHKKESWK